MNVNVDSDVNLSIYFSGCLLLGGFLIFFLMSKAGQRLLQQDENNRSEMDIEIIEF